MLLLILFLKKELAGLNGQTYPACLHRFGGLGIKKILAAVNERRKGYLSNKANG